MTYVYIKTTKDKYEFIVAMGDTVEALAKECGTTKNTIYSAMSHAKAKGKSSIYKKVVLK
jgi:hypothetical protein